MQPATIKVRLPVLCCGLLITILATYQPYDAHQARRMGDEPGRSTQYACSRAYYYIRSLHYMVAAE